MVMPKLSVLNENSGSEDELVERHGSEDGLKNVVSQRHCTMEFFEIFSITMQYCKLIYKQSCCSYTVVY